MRIIAGEWRRRLLKVPTGEATRPSADRTKETLFGMLQSRLGSFEDLRVADMFAGSGALGLEALSRGAAHCIFVEQEASALRALRANIAALQAQSKCDVRATSVLSLGKVAQPLDLILLDPPYLTGAGSVALDKLNRLGWIGPATIMVLETAHNEDVKLKALTITEQRKVGSAKLTFMQQEPAS